MGGLRVSSKKNQDSPVALLDRIPLCLLHQRLTAGALDHQPVAQKRLSVIFPPNMLSYNTQGFQEATIVI